METDFMSYIDASAGAASDFVGNIDTTAVADGASSWMETGIKYANNAFDWMNNNPETTNLLAGIAGGVGQYLTSQQQLEQEQKFAEEQWRREREARRINPGEIKGYGSHVATAKSGLLTNGMIAPDEENK